MTRFLRTVITAFVLSCCMLCRAAEKPNILIIVSDDQGYADAGFQGSRDLKTPHLDALAASGVRCVSGYVTYPVCSPSRAGLLTGRYQARFGHENNPVYDPLDRKEGLPLTETLLPQVLKSAGYHTGWIGKWHLGSAPEFVPWARGFDESFGFIGGGHRFTGWKPNERQYTLPLIRNGNNIADVPSHLTTAFGNEAADFVRRNKQSPWMLYLPFNAPHTPHEPLEETLGQFSHIQNEQRRKYAAQISLMDGAIGNVLTALDETQQRERTLIFFFSDNGGQTAASSDNGVLRERKGTLYEGGVRVPFLVSWPGTIPAGAEFLQPVSTLDIFATSVSAAGITSPAPKPLDGVNLLPHLTGADSEAPHKQLFWRMSGRRSFAVREGNWKLLRIGDAPAELYDLATDVSEKNNVAAAHADVTARLTADLEAWNKQLVDPVFPGSSVKSEDWGPGGANQKNAQKKKKAGK